MPEADGSPPGPRPFWSGTLAFGLVSVPVQLFSAVRGGSGSLRMVAEDGTPLEQRYVCPREGRPVPRDEIVRGYDVAPAGGDEEEWVVVTEEELEGLQPEKTREIDLRMFVPVGELDPVFFERAYVLTPGGGSNKAYRLLARVMEEAGRAGLATFVMRSREYLVAILARDGILRAETLRFAPEVRTPEDIGLPEPGKAPRARVTALAGQIEDAEREEIDRVELQDRAARELEALVEEKREKGRDVVEVRGAESGSGSGGREVVLDLMEVLRRSLAEGDDGDAQEDRRSAGPASGDDGLEDRTRDELYARARELDIPGRSSMTKDELMEAIRKAG